MRIWRFHEFGDIHNLRLEDSATPVPQPDEALVKMAYAALNPADAFVVRGLYPRSGPPPMAVGRDGSGVVETPGSSGRFKKGDRVIVLRSEIGVTRDGTLAEYTAVPETSLAPLPDGWSLQEGAAGPLVLLTAWMALVQVGGLTPGQTVLVNGASGGVGTASVMLAHALGAHVVAASRSENKRARLKELGADVVVDSRSPDALEDAVREALGERCIDIVVENLAGPYLQASVNVAGEQGRIAVIGMLGGMTSEIIAGSLLFKRVRIEGVAVGSYTPPEAQAAWTKIVEVLARKNAKPVIDSEFSMNDVLAGFEKLTEGPMGKVLIRVKN